MQYNAIEQPDPEIWLELDETERVDLVIDYHRRIGVQLETLELHAMAHVVVENQVALGGVTPVPETLDRLMDEGLDRHEAVHAIGSILMETVFDAVHNRRWGRHQFRLLSRARPVDGCWLAIPVEIDPLG
jgi:hypothetical protein